MFVFILVSPPGATKGAHEGVKGVYASIAKKKPVLRNISLLANGKYLKTSIKYRNTATNTTKTTPSCHLVFLHLNAFQPNRGYTYLKHNVINFPFIKSS